MSIKMFFEFPGILILVGIVLLILSIVIGLIAYKKVDKEELVFSLSEEDDKEMDKNLMPEVTIIDEPNIVENNSPMIDDIKIEAKPVFLEEEKLVEEEKPVREKEVKIYGGNSPKTNINVGNYNKVVNEDKKEVSKEEIEVL